MWELLHADIVSESRSIAEAGKFDEAIFAAFKFIEATIQERISSRSIGDTLIVEAFEGASPRIDISSDSRDQRGIQNLFSGAMSNIRNDRGHKKKPLTPCETLNDCILYLGFASFLLYLLAKDRNTYPKISGLRVLGTAEEPRAELRGLNFVGSQVLVTAAGKPVTVVRSERELLEVLLPKHFYGDIAVSVDGKPGGDVYCDANSRISPESHYEVVAVELPLYSDSKASMKRHDVVGLLLKANEAGREFLRIVPTKPNQYSAGCYVTHGPYSSGSGVGETWYIDADTGRSEYAWTSSAIAEPNVLGPAGNFKLGGISIAPNVVHTQVGENRCLRVVGWGRDGSIRKDLDVSDRVKWKNSNSSFAHVNGGVVIPKKLGSVRAECELDGFVASVEISVEHLVRGQRTTYFQGLRRLQQIRFDRDDSLYICNQGPSVYRLDKTGAFTEVLRISTNPMAAYGISSVAIDQSKNLYVNDISKHTAYKFSWNGHAYANPEEIAKIVTGAKQSIAVLNSGEVFVAVMGAPHKGWIVRRAPSGEEKAIEVDGMPIWMAAGPDNRIYLPVANGSSVLVYEADGTLADRIILDNRGSSVSDLLVDKDGAIYMALFRTGEIIRIKSVGSTWHSEVIATNFGTPGGIAADSHGRIYVSDFAGDSIDVIY